MSRAALTAIFVSTVVAGAVGAQIGVHSHLDPSLVTGGCMTCHEGHGISQSPMLTAPQKEVCLSCHGSAAAANRQVARGALSANTTTTLLDGVLSLPFAHPLTEGAFSRLDSDAVTCTSCHSAHRSMAARQAAVVGRGSGKKLSPQDPNRFEVELCQSCHGSAGAATQSFLDLSRLTSPTNASFHPLEGPVVERSPSLLPQLSSREINCTDCHGNSDPRGPRGPHGSSVRYILRAEYTTIDGQEESQQTYALCYSCHERQKVLDSPLFPLHRLHVVEERATCASCHDPHGSVDNRALIRFGEETYLGGAGPSLSTGRLAFVSAGPGSGTCYLTCHGVDHAATGYGPGGVGSFQGLGRSDLTAPSSRPPGSVPNRIPSYREATSSVGHQ